MANVRDGVMSSIAELETKMGASFKRAADSLDDFAKRKSRILAIQNGSQRYRIPGAQVTLREGSLRALWTEKARKGENVKKAAPAGAVKAEALRWENRRLAEAKEKLEGLTRDQQRRIIQLEEALSDLKSTPGRRSNSLSRTASGTSDPGTPSRRVSSGEPDVAALQAAVEEARAKAVAAEAAQKAILAERDTARQMLHGIKAMLAQSEALRQSSDSSHPVKVQSLQREVDRLQASLARTKAEAAADCKELKAVKAERDLALQTLAEVKSAVASSEAARSTTLRQLQDAIQREKSSLETKVAEMDARCAGYVAAMQRAEREAVADKECIAALRAAVARLHAQAKAAKAEREAAEKRQAEVAEDRRRRTMTALREAEQSRSQLLCDKAAAEHDCAQALAAKEAAEKQAASLKALLESLEGSSAKQPVVPEVSRSSADPNTHSASVTTSRASRAHAQEEQSYTEAATQTDSAWALGDDSGAQQQGTEAGDETAGAGEALPKGTHSLETPKNENQAQRWEEVLELKASNAELRAELARVKEAAAAAAEEEEAPLAQASGEQGSPESPPETSRADVAPRGPTTPVTASSEGLSRSSSSPDSADPGSAERQPPCGRRRRPLSLELWSPGSSHPLSSPPTGSVDNSPALHPSDETSTTGTTSHSRRSSSSVMSSMMRSPPEHALSDGEADVFEDARSRAASNASSLDMDAYFDAESELDAPQSATSPGRSDALAQMQEKLAAAVARAEELERERGDAARLARLHGRAVETQAAALRAAEASLARKRADVLAADRARAAAEAALAKSTADRRADDKKVQQIAAELERSLAEAHGEKQRLEEANAEQAALIPALQESCKAAESKVLELQSQLERVSRQADETGRCLHAAVEAARRSEAAARDEVKTLELCNEQLLSEKEWTWDTMQAMEARVEELLSSQAQATAAPADCELQRQIASLEAELSAACSALAQARTEAAGLQQECMQLRHEARQLEGQQKGSPPLPDPVTTWLARSLSKAGSPLASWRRSSGQRLPTR
ncbi:g2362 [Coccomyxa elongata]